MGLKDDICKLKTGDRDLRKFGVTVGVVFVLAGLVFLLRHQARYPFFIGAGAALLLAGLVSPRSLKYIYLVWMSVGLAVGLVMAHVILTLFFFLMVTPIGLAARLAGKDFLSLRLDRRAKSYWIKRAPRSPAPSDYERQF